MGYQEEQDEDLEDPEWPDESDMHEDDDSVEMEQCPSCRKPVYEQSNVCPHCGSYISQADGSNRKPLWIMVAVVVCLAAIVLFWLR